MTNSVNPSSARFDQAELRTCTTSVAWLFAVCLVPAAAAQSVSNTAAPQTTPAGTAAPVQPAPGTGTAPGTASATRLSVGDATNIVRLTGPAGDVVLTVTGLGEAVDRLAGEALMKHAATVAIADGGRLGAPAPHKVTIVPQQFLGRTNAGGLSWLVRVQAEGFPASSIEKRILRLSLGPPETRGHYALEYTLTNQPLTSARYDVTVPSHDWMVSWSAPDKERTYPLMIVNKSEPIIGLKLTQSSLKRADDGSSIRFEQFQLLPSADGRPGQIDVKPNETRTVFLRLEPSAGIGPFGTFAGQIHLVSEGTAPQPVPLTARATSAGIKRVGAALVLFGLIISLVVTNHLQPRLARLQALRPAIALRDLLETFIKKSEELAGTDAAGIAAEAARQRERLDPAALDAAELLPPAISVAGGPTGSAASRLQTLLNDISARLAALMVLRDAVVQLATLHPKIRRPARVVSAIVNLNAAAPQTATADAAHNAVAAIVAAMEAARTEESVGPGFIPASVTTQQLDFMLHQTANIAAFIWAAVSLAIGVTYVYSDVDFGTPADLLGMFLWGFGLTTFGAGIQQLTPRTVATQIGINVPKTGATT